MDLNITTFASEIVEVSSDRIVTCREALEMLWVSFLELLDYLEPMLCLGELPTQLIESLEDEGS